MQVHGITGLEESVFYLVVEEVAIHLEHQWEATSGRQRSLDLPAAVAITLAYLRHNLTQRFLASTFNVHQATIFGTITTLTPPIAEALTPMIPTKEEARSTAHGTVVLINGTLCPTRS
ncbi:transposase family protein [Natronoglycomyces albus]|uniref:Transposase family protein n=1 Tax=Natronoglycomyces albus TaxID=2811108 RepID=A0A895XM93_9ACTN|nr:transposase family protein [Natronoglycomyces albus]QSB04892.1 transposase family protein [Natronoglycomyces albus]